MEVDSRARAKLFERLPPKCKSLLTFFGWSSLVVAGTLVWFGQSSGEVCLVPLWWVVDVVVTRVHVNFPGVSHVYLTIAMLGLESWWIVEAERCMMFVLCVCVEYWFNGVLYMVYTYATMHLRFHLGLGPWKPRWINNGRRRSVSNLWTCFKGVGKGGCLNSTKVEGVSKVGDFWFMLVMKSSWRRGGTHWLYFIHNLWFSIVQCVVEHTFHKVTRCCETNILLVTNPIEFTYVDLESH